MIESSTATHPGFGHAVAESSPVVLPLATINCANVLCALSSCIAIWPIWLVSELCDAELNALCALCICALIWLISLEFEPCAAAPEACDDTCASWASSEAISAFNSSTSLVDELLEDAEPPPPPPPPRAPRAPEDAEALDVELDDVPPLDPLAEAVALLPFAFDDAAPDEAPLFAPLVEVCAPAAAFEADALPVPLP
ncbi:MAG TPA: hypothetical protein VMJ11_31330 [Paraburkholderia sp.]|nr:hypothetical protein [Paraburkholderia sp.]